MPNEQITGSECGLVHPDKNNPLSVRLMDDGRIAIMAGEHSGVILDRKSGAVTIFGSSVNFISDDVKVNGVPIDVDALVNQAAKEWDDRLRATTAKATIVKDA